MKHLLALALLSLPCAAQGFAPTLAMTYPGFPPPLIATWATGQTGRIQVVTIPGDVEASEPCYGGGWGTFLDGRVIWLRGRPAGMPIPSLVTARLDFPALTLDYGVECTHQTEPLGIVTGGASLEPNLTFGFPLEEYPGHTCDNNWLAPGVCIVGSTLGWGWSSDYLEAFDGVVDFAGDSGYFKSQSGWYPPETFTGDTNRYNVRRLTTEMSYLPVYLVPTFSISAARADGTPIDWGHGATFEWAGRMHGPITLHVEYVD